MKAHHAWFHLKDVVVRLYQLRCACTYLALKIGSASSSGSSDVIMLQIAESQACERERALHFSGVVDRHLLDAVIVLAKTYTTRSLVFSNELAGQAQTGISWS